MARLLVSANKAQGGGSRPSQHLFYLHIVLLVVMAACSVTVWAIMRRNHIETLVLAHTWAQTHHQLVREANINRLLMHAHLAQDADTVAEIVVQVARDAAQFDHVYRNLMLGDPLFTADVGTSIETWLAQVRDAVEQRSVPCEIADASDIQDALWTLVASYNDRMKNSISYRADVVAMVFLSITTFLVIVLMFLVGAEFHQLGASVKLAEELAAVIHDVRTPQQVIMSAIALLSRPGVNSNDTADLIQLISDSCSATQRLLDTVLVRLRGQAATEPIPLPHAFQSVSNIQSVICRDKGVDWRFTMSQAASIYAHFERDAVLQITNNIVSNAIRYTDGGVVALAVDVRASKRPRFPFPLFRGVLSLQHQLVITVTDTGRGIAKESLAAVFQKFKQETSGSGFGIGLFTVARLINSCNGCIDLWSEPGKGTTFIVCVPIQVVAPFDVEDDASPGTALISQQGESGVACLNIALLDDDAVTMKLSKRILASAGHEVRVFTNGDELLEQFHSADVIVSDVNMPGAMTGMELATRVRAAGYQGAMIAHTGDSLAHESCIESGFDAVMAKPTPAPLYIETIESVYKTRKSPGHDLDTTESPNLNLTLSTETHSQEGGNINQQ